MKKFILICLSVFSVSCIASKPLTIALDNPANPEYAPIIIAKTKGFFQEQNLTINLLTTKTTTRAIKAVTTKKAEISIDHEPQFMQARDQGLPLISFGTLIDKPLASLVTLQNSGMNNIQALKHKRIGLAATNLNRALLNKILQRYRLNLTDVTIVNINTDLSQSLASHQVDAIMNANRNTDIAKLEASAQKVNVFFPEEHGIPNYSEFIFITNKAYIHDPRLPRFLAALKKAVAYLDTHPEKAWASYVNLYPKANSSINRSAWFATLPFFAEDPARIRIREWRAFITFMAENKLIKTQQPLNYYLSELPRAIMFSPKT